MLDGTLSVFNLLLTLCFASGFRKLGLDCANWTEPIYKDLLKYAVAHYRLFLLLDTLL